MRTNIGHHRAAERRELPDPGDEGRAEEEGQPGGARPRVAEGHGAHLGGPVEPYPARVLDLVERFDIEAYSDFSAK